MDLQRFYAVKPEDVSPTPHKNLKSRMLQTLFLIEEFSGKELSSTPEGQALRRKILTIANDINRFGIEDKEVK